MGRIFLLRLEHGDVIPDTIEKFAGDLQIQAALVHFLGGADTGSKVVVGPRDGREQKPVKMVTELTGTSEAVGMGTIFLNEKGLPSLHLHASFGREKETITGCTRDGVKVWHIGEVVILELLKTGAGRKVDGKTGFELLELEE